MSAPASMLADGWVYTDPEGIVDFELSTDQVLVSTRSLRVTVTGTPASATEEAPYFATFAKTLSGLTPGRTYFPSGSQYPEPGSDFVFDTPVGTWTEKVGSTPLIANEDGEVTFTIAIGIIGAGFTPPVVGHLDHICLSTEWMTEEEPGEAGGALVFLDDFTVSSERIDPA